MKMKEKRMAMGRPKANRETKIRITLSVLPSLYEEVKKVAFIERKSVSEVVAEMMACYVTGNADKVAEYEKAKRGGSIHGI